MTTEDLKKVIFKCDYCSRSSCKRRHEHYYHGKELCGIVVGCVSWVPTRQAKCLINDSKTLSIPFDDLS